MLPLRFNYYYYFIFPCLNIATFAASSQLTAKIQNNTRKGIFRIFLAISLKKSKNSLFSFNYLMMWSFTSSILRDVDLIILNSKLLILITSLSFGKL